MKKVLLITTHFAPDRHIGAKRVTKFAKYLPDFGWQPIVLTQEIRRYHGLDRTLLEELPEDISIYRTLEWNLFRSSSQSDVTHQPTRGKPDRRSRDHWRKIMVRRLDFFLFYNYSWLLPAFLIARRLVHEQGIDLIYSSVPNPEAHLVALLLRLTLPVKWVCEYRDPWTTLPDCYSPLSPLQPSTDRWLERQIFEQADCLLFVGRGYQDLILRDQPDHLSHKSAILYNGYDENDFDSLISSCEGDSSDKLVIGHIGTLGKWVTPEPFLRGLGSAIRGQDEMLSNILVRFIGEVKFDPQMEEDLLTIIEEEGLQDVVRIEAFLPHREALAEMCDCDLLLLIRGRPDELPELGLATVPAKFFEYLRAQRPVLALVPPEGDAARLTHELGAGVVVDPGDVDAIGQAILDLYTASRRGELKVQGDVSKIKQYERRTQTKQLAKLFAYVVT